jgi:hypothetical protein
MIGRMSHTAVRRIISTRGILNWWGPSLLITIVMFGACMAAGDYDVAIPSQTDWIECGPIFSAGSEGEWDRYLWGGFASTVVNKDGVYYLYYQGANGYDDDEGTVTWRSIGVATSSDGYRFTKYEGNPVLTWFPHNNLEEGAVSGGAFVNDIGETLIYYGANSWAGGSLVNADARLAISADGFDLIDMGIVLDHTDTGVWGWGDELFPIIGFQDNGRWFTYYIPNGVLQRGKLGVAWGYSPHELTRSTAARSGRRTIAVWGPGSSAKIGPDVYALFTNNVYGPGGPVLEVRTVSLDAPARLSKPVASYRFENVWEAVVYLNNDASIWLMYYRSADHEHYGLKVAAADDREPRCPGAEVLYMPLIPRVSRSFWHGWSGLIAR